MIDEKIDEMIDERNDWKNKRIEGIMRLRLGVYFAGKVFLG